jgi:CP family cyanate transporter-like MFS transporter
MAVGYVGLLVAPAAGAVAWVVALGLGVSTFPLCLTLVNARTRTTTGSTVLSGAMQGLGYAVASIGPLGVGLLRTTTDGWGAPFAVLFVSLAVLLAAGVVACRPSVLEDQVRRPELVDA